MLWATLKIPLPNNLGNVTADMMFDCPVDFIKAAGEENKQFVIFPTT